MIALSKEKRFQIVKKGDEMAADKAWKKRFLYGLAYHICFCIVIGVLAFSWFGKSTQEKNGLVPVWVEPDYKRNVTEYYKLLRGD